MWSLLSPSVWVKLCWQPGFLKPPLTIITPKHTFRTKHFALCLNHSKCSLNICWAISEEKKKNSCNETFSHRKGPTLDLSQYPLFKTIHKVKFAAPIFFSVLAGLSINRELKNSIETSLQIICVDMWRMRTFDAFSHSAQANSAGNK